MKSVEYLTAMILAKRSLHQPVGDEAVFWADLLLAQGWDCNEIKNLICHDKASSPAQLEKLVDDCLTQLGISLVDEKLAHVLLIWAWIQKLLKTKISADDFLETMQRLCVDFGHEPTYMQFYLLHSVKKDLAKGTIVFHDREVDENNFEQVLRWEVDLFLDGHETTLLDQIRIKK